MEPQPHDDRISLLRLAFKELGDDELREMADLTELRTYPPGHILCHEGAFEEVFYIIAEGNVAITKKIIGEDAERRHAPRLFAPPTNVPCWRWKNRISKPS